PGARPPAAGRARSRRLVGDPRPGEASGGCLPVPAPADQPERAADPDPRRGAGPRHDPARDRPRAHRATRRSRPAVAGGRPGARGTPPSLPARGRRHDPGRVDRHLPRRAPGGPAPPTDAGALLPALLHPFRPGRAADVDPPRRERGPGAAIPGRAGPRAPRLISLTPPREGAEA